jgi:hypothetical protein
VLGKDRLWFSDPARQRRNYGGAALDSLADFVAMPEAQRRRLDTALGALPISAHAGAPLGQTYNWRKVVGYDFWQVDQMIYTGPHTDFANFSHLVGRLDAAAINKGLQAIGYRPRAYRNGEILEPEDKFAAAQAAGQEATDFVIVTEAITVKPGMLTATRFSDTIEQGIDAASGATPTLADNPDYRAAASALTGAVGGTMLSPVGLYRPDPAASRSTPTIPAQPYATALPEYRLAGFGLQDDGTTRSLSLALVYNTAADANAAMPILRQRLDSYTLESRMAGGRSTALRERLVPSTASVHTADGRSVLVQPMTIPDERDSRLWLNMLLLGDVNFLRER